MTEPDQVPPFLRIANWERFQNADVFGKSKGRPPWIKTYVAQLEHFAYGQLTPSERGWLHDLRLLAATVENKIPNDPAWLRTRLGIPAGVRRMPPLARLSELGFLEPWQSQGDVRGRLRRHRGSCMKAHDQLGLLDEPDDGLSLGEWMATLPRTPFEEEVGEKGPTVWEARAHSVPFLSAALQGPGGALENAARLAKTPTEE